MDIYKSAIIRYEAARAARSKLKKERGELIFNCENFEAKGKTCLESCFNECVSNADENGFIDNFSDALTDGGYCENCQQSYAIKIGDLAKANQEFGNSKKSLSALAKGLLKQRN
jgi:hypothetical protein